MTPRVVLAALAGGLCVSGSPNHAGVTRLGVSGGAVWWRSDRAPVAWTAPRGDVLEAIRWRAEEDGVAWGELVLRGSGAAWRTRVVLLRLVPARVKLVLANGVSPDGLVAGWRVTDAPSEAVAAFNAGQFSGAAVWGRVRHAGVDYRPPRRGPLAATVLVRRDGGVAIASDAEADALLGGDGAGVSEAFQSYPRLLERGVISAPLRREGHGVDLGHRDARLALGTGPDGTVLVALTRFDGLGAGFGGVPFGLTLPETAALMGALGCRDAVALDGGISAQLLIRDRSGRHPWNGLRSVPLALVATRR